MRVEARELVKEIDYQIQLRIIEARQLSGMQLDPVCTVSIANQKKHTAVKEQTNTPFWDEFFVFDFKMPAPVLFDKIINFQVFTGRNLVSHGLLIGSFKVEKKFAPSTHFVNIHNNCSIFKVYKKYINLILTTFFSLISEQYMLNKIIDLFGVGQF